MEWDTETISRLNGSYQFPSTIDVDSILDFKGLSLWQGVERKFHKNFTYAKPPHPIYSMLLTKGKSSNNIGINGPVTIEILIQNNDHAFAVWCPKGVFNADLGIFGFGRVRKDGGITERHRLTAGRKRKLKIFTNDHTP